MTLLCEDLPLCILPLLEIVVGLKTFHKKSKTYKPWSLGMCRGWKSLCCWVWSVLGAVFILVFWCQFWIWLSLPIKLASHFLAARKNIASWKEPCEQNGYWELLHQSRMAYQRLNSVMAILNLWEAELLFCSSIQTEGMKCKLFHFPVHLVLFIFLSFFFLRSLPPPPPFLLSCTSTR